MSDKWKDLGPEVSWGNLMNNVFGQDTRVVENKDTGETRRITVGQSWDSRSVGDKIRDGDFGD